MCTVQTIRQNYKAIIESVKFQSIVQHFLQITVWQILSRISVGAGMGVSISRKGEISNPALVNAISERACDASMISFL